MYSLQPCRYRVSLLWTGLFYQAQDNSIQTEMAFLEASKQQRAGLAPGPVGDGDTQTEKFDTQAENIVQEEGVGGDSADKSSESKIIPVLSSLCVLTQQ